MCEENGDHTPRILALPILALSRKEKRYNNVTHGINLKSNFRTNFFSNTFCSSSDMLFQLSTTSGWMIPKSGSLRIAFSALSAVTLGTFSGGNGVIIGGLIESMTIVDCGIVVRKFSNVVTLINCELWQNVH